MSMISLSAPSFAGLNGRKSRIFSVTFPIASLTFPIAPFIPSAILPAMFLPAFRNLPNIPLMVFKAPVIPFLTALFTRLNALDTTPRKELKIFLTVFLIWLRIFLITFMIAFQILEITERILDKTDCIVLLIEFQILETKLLTLFRTPRITFMIAFQMLETVDRMLDKTDCIVLLIEFHILDMKLLTLFIILLTLFFTALNAFDTVERTADVALRNKPVILLHILETMERRPLNNAFPAFKIFPTNHNWIKFHTSLTAPDTICLTASHNADQFPVNSAEKACIIPVMTLIAPCIAPLIAFHVEMTKASTTGHTAFITVPITVIVVLITVLITFHTF